jgi:soluble lytic murein transglycosylase-like protein
MARRPRPAQRFRPLAVALVLGATMSVGAQVPAFGQRADQTAMSVPRPASQAGIAGFPQPLAPSDAARLRRVFDLQARGETAAAAREADRLDDRRLHGHVLADRWLRAQDAPVPELLAWLAEHRDHPDAPAIHALLVRKAPAGTALPPPPAQEQLSDGMDVVPEERERGSVTRNASLDRAVRERAGNGDIQGALTAIARARVEGTYAALLRAEVAQALFQQGRDEEALGIAAHAARGAPSAAFPAFIAGLSAWALERPDLAMPWFETAARAEIGSSATRAAAAYWAARTAVRVRRPQHYVPWMTQAAQEQRTFYGLVARRSLGLPLGFAWERELAGESDAAAIAETAGGWRALALLQIGQTDRAEAELRLLWPRVQGNPGVVRAMLLVASQAGMPDLAAQLAGLSQSADGRPRDYARYPLPALQPQNGFRIDPALLYALARQESNFNPAAVSRAGARGLLQIMPATASYVTGDASLRGAGARRLHEPAFALEVGQRYLHYLARHEQVGGDLIRLLAAYNNGPGNLARWQPAVRHRDDPFLFIESIPVVETRSFVQRVMTYSWIYATRLGLPSPSLDALAAGRFPHFPTAAEVAEMVAAPRR